MAKAEILKLRTAPPPDIPQDKAFTPRSAAEDKAREADKKGLADRKLEEADVSSATNADKIAHWEAQAQDLANATGNAVLVHYVRVPGFQHTPPTLGCFLVPGSEIARPAPVSRKATAD